MHSTFWWWFLVLEKEAVLKFVGNSKKYCVLEFPSTRNFWSFTRGEDKIILWLKRLTFHKFILRRKLARLFPSTIKFDFQHFRPFDGQARAFCHKDLFGTESLISVKRRRNGEVSFESDFLVAHCFQIIASNVSILGQRKKIDMQSSQKASPSVFNLSLLKKGVPYLWLLRGERRDIPSPVCQASSILLTPKLLN